MRTIYSTLLSAIILLSLSFSAAAETYSASVEWNIPGAATVSVGMGASAQYPVINDDGTSCSFSYDNYTSAPYLYVVPSDASKYYIKAAYYTPEGGEETKLGSANGSKASISPSYYNGNKIRIEFAEISYDSEFTIRVINGRDKFNEKSPSLASAGGNINLTLKTGDNKIKFCEGYHTAVTVRAAAYDQTTEPYYHSDAYVKINGEDGTLSGTKFMTTFLNNQTIHNNDVFEIRYWDVDDEVEEAEGPFTVTINADELGAKAINMIFNKTKSSSISARDQFEVDANNIFTISCNTYDYTVTINGERLADNPSDAQKYTVWTSPEITEDLTVNISAVVREYGTSNITIAVTEPDGIDILPGAMTADPIDLSQFEGTTVSFQNKDYTQYVIPVSNKSCKLFTSVKDGYWLRSSLDAEGEEAYIATPEQILYIDNPKFNVNGRIAFYVECGEDLNGFTGSLNNVGLYDAEIGGEPYTLTEGINYFDVDLDYVNGALGTGMRIRPFNIRFEDDADLGIQATPFSVYQNFSTLTRDDNDVFHAIVNDKDIIRVYIGVPATIYDVDLALGPNSDLKISLDNIQDVNMEDAIDEGSFKAFAGQLATVTSESNRAFCLSNMLDDEDAEALALTDGKYEFKFGSKSKAIFEPRADIKLHTAEDGSVSDLSSLTISFPEAKSAKAVLPMDEIMVRENNWTWTPISITMEQVADAEVPTFKFILSPADAPFGNYSILVPEGFFVVTAANGSTLDNVDFWESFTYASPVSQDDLAITFDPEADYVMNDEGVLVTAIINEKFDFPRQIDLEKITVTFNDEPVTEFQHMVEGNYLMFGFAVEGEGELTLSLAEGVALIENVPTPAASKTWKVILPKEYTYELTPSLDDAIPALSEIILAFPEAKTAELYNTVSGFALKSKDYSYTNYAPVVEAVEDAEVPTFKITFDPAPTADGEYQFSISHEVFLLDGCQYNSVIDKSFTIDSSLSAIGGINAGNNANITVISVDGRVILKDAPASELKSLDNGVYIINGKKVIL